MHPPCRSFFDKLLHLWKLFSVDYIQYLYLVASEIVTPPVCVCVHLSSKFKSPWVLIQMDLPCEEGMEDVQHGSAVLATVEGNTHLLKAVGE